MNNRLELITLCTIDDLRLRGLFLPPAAGRPVILHVHGNSGNFYENLFLDEMINIYGEFGFGFLAFGNRGHDVVAEAYRGERLTYIGGALERFEEATFDLDAAVAFGIKHTSTVILQGHSFGCLKIINYLIARNGLIDCILLSPADTLQLQLNYMHPESIETQVQRIRGSYSQCPDSILPKEEFGIRQPETEYHIPISAGTFLSLFEGPYTQPLSYSARVQYKVESSAFIYCGGRDPLLTVPVAQIEDFFAARFKSLEFCFIESGNHHMAGAEIDVVRSVAIWIRDSVMLQ